MVSAERDALKAPAKTFTVRAATRDDVDALFAMIVALAEHHGQRAYLRADAEQLRRDGFGEQPRFAALVAETADGLIGFATYAWHYTIWLGATTMNIDDVYVADTHRGLGVGEALMMRARELCQAQGGARLRWEVQPDNAAAIRFYQRLGAVMRSKGIFTWDAGSK